jgi:hypothetical protein
MHRLKSVTNIAEHVRHEDGVVTLSYLCEGLGYASIEGEKEALRLIPDTERK